MRTLARMSPLSATVCLLLSSAPTQAQTETDPRPQEGPDPATVVRSMAEAFNQGDLEEVVTYFGDRFQLTMRPAFPRTSDRTEQVSTRDWAEKLIDNDFRIEVEVLKAEGDRVQTRTRTWQNITRLMGMTPLVGIEDYVVEDGRITSLTWTATDEALERFYAFRKKFFFGLVLLGLLTAAVIWWLIRRRRRTRLA